MNLKNKTIAVLLIAFAILLIVPSIVNAATEYTYSDTEQGIEWVYELDSSNNVVNLRCNTTTVKGTVTIPSAIEEKTVISLADAGSWVNGAFKDCTGLTGVTIPDTIVEIGRSAFENCTGLKTVTIPNSVTQIGSSAFRGCSGLTSVVFSTNITTIESYAFAECTGLKTVTIPDSVVTLETAAFKKCSGLKELNLSNNLTTIEDRTFEGCSGLTSVIIPDSVTTIEGEYTNIYGAFGDCTNLAKVLIPDTVASIGKGTFQGCDKLTIYGNDGMTSKDYAEENGIAFDYIANWDKENSGQDITAPTVEDIEVTYASIMNYDKDTNTGVYIVPTDAKLVINVHFSEVIQGTTVPTLTIKFGSGENIEITEGTVSGSTITYIYTIKSTDKGTMTTVKFEDGNITDAAGNAATLTCPALSIQYDTLGNDLIYANGTVTNPDDDNQGENDGNDDEEQSGENNNQNTGTNGENQNTNNQDGKEDNSVSPAPIPNAGKATLITMFVAIILVGVISFAKVRKYKEI